MRKVGTKLIILVRFDVSLHKPIASMLDLLYLCLREDLRHLGIINHVSLLLLRSICCIFAINREDLRHLGIIN